MPASIGIFVLSELTGTLRDTIRALHERFDPKLGRLTPPHLTITGSSGVGMIDARTPIADLRAALEPIAATTPPLTLAIGAPHRFPGTEIVSLPLDPHGPLRTLHERIAASGLRFARSRFAFSPHITLSYYPTLTRERERELLALHIDTPLIVDRLQVYLTRDPQPARQLFALALDETRPVAAEVTAPSDRARS
ncbi:MAG: 2'-5' RNA ligase family protein [Gemmatimonadaceae bacterium]|jgi:2'-5' RNA ligase|nr:2'-5' RNA ligase family protein [Gemmatimonadaceae bacterium]